MIDSKILLEEIKAFEAQLVKSRRHLHENPETGFELSHTREYVREELTAMGYTPKDCGKCGLTALVGKGTSGKTFLLRADMDALPVTEHSGEAFSSHVPGKMHACGHDLHTSMLLGAAKLLKLHENEITGTVKFMFQPSEETLEGSKDMIEHGVLERPSVDAALMIHATMGMPFPAGSVIVCDGGISAPAADYFNIRIQGKGCHGAMPQLGIDPITIAAHVITGLQELNARELAMSDEAALTIGRIHAGETGNVIPDEAFLEGTIRAYDEGLRNHLKQRMEELCQGIAAAFRGSVKVTFSSGCPTLKNDASLSQAVTRYCKELLGEQNAFSASELSALAGSNEKASKATGSEDFAYVSQKVPSIMLAVAAGSPQNGYTYPLHHPMVRFDEKAIASGSCIYAYTALRWLEEQDTIIS